jgi:DNA-binding MarR family transcriptional regulator
MPVLVKTILLDLPEISDEMRDRIMQSRLERMREKYLSTIAEEAEDMKQEELDSDKIHILKDYAHAPYESMTEKALKLGYSVATFVRHLKELREQDFLEEAKVNLGKALGVVKLYKLSEQAIKIVGKQNLVGRGSMVHGFWMNVIKQYYESEGDKEVVLEMYDEQTGKLVDVAVLGKNEQGEKVVAVEIALSNKFLHEADNVEKCVALGFEEVISAAPSELILRGIKQELLNRNIQGLEKVQYKLLKEFYHELETRRAGR